MSVILATPVSRDKVYCLFEYVQGVRALEPPPNLVLLVFDHGDVRTPAYYAWAFKKIAPKIPVKTITSPKYDDHLDAIGHARNRCIQFAREEKADYLFFLDADIVCAPSAIERLIACNNGISSGLVATRELPPGLGHRNTRLNAYLQQEVDGRTVYVPHPEVPKEVIKVDVVGNDCMMIHKDLFMRQMYDWRTEQPRQGEDFNYCLRAKEAGFEVTVDGTVWCDHYSPVEIFTSRSGKAVRISTFGGS